jgi:hypothetical protein
MISPQEPLPCLSQWRNKINLVKGERTGVHQRGVVVEQACTHLGFRLDDL